MDKVFVGAIFLPLLKHQVSSFNAIIIYPIFAAKQILWEDVTID